MNFDEAKERLLGATPILHGAKTVITETEFPCISASHQFSNKLPWVEPVPEQKEITEPIPFLAAMKFLGIEIMYESPHELEREKYGEHVPWARYVKKDVARIGSTIFLRVRNSPATIIHELVHAVQEYLDTWNPLWDMFSGVNNHEFQAWFLECAISGDNDSFETLKYMCSDMTLDRLHELIEDNKKVIMNIWDFLKQFER